MGPSSLGPRALVIGAALAAKLTGCGQGGEIEPTRVEQPAPFDRGPRPARVREPGDPLRDPSTETPRAREGQQLSPGAIELALAEATRHASVGDVAQQRNALRRCANKIPASARCDGELGLTMVSAKRWRATAIYYLVEAARTDDPDASAQLYVRVGEGLRRHGRLREATLALERAHAREGTAEHAYLLGQVLSLQPDRIADAADRIAQARALDDRLEWLHDEAVLRGQIPVREQAEAAAQLFRAYAARAARAPATTQPTPPAIVEGRIAELERLAKTYKTQAEASP